MLVLVLLLLALPAKKQQDKKQQHSFKTIFTFWRTEDNSKEVGKSYLKKNSHKNDWNPCKHPLFDIQPRWKNKFKYKNKCNKQKLEKRRMK